MADDLAHGLSGANIAQVRFRMGFVMFTTTGTANL